ncbi:MAG: hypothetical protein ABR907_08905 [Terracidiphilus sp.]|jgi:hypothetical protein
MTKLRPLSKAGPSINAECIEYSDRTSLHISERGVGATFLNPRRKQLRKIRYDGCYNETPRKRQADYIVGMAQVVDVIVELKGSDLKHAVTQIEITLEAWAADPIRYPRIVCLIVFGRIEAKRKGVGKIPRMGSKIGTIEREFLLTHETLLWVRESGSEKFRFNKLLGKSS